MTLRRHPDPHRGAVERRPAAMGLGDRAYDRESEAGAAAGARAVSTGEALERAAGDVGREAGTVVGDLERHAAVLRVRAEHDVAVPVAERVVHEVAERLADA